MFKTILKSLAPVALLALVSAPATAQPSSPNLEIRIARSAPPRVRHERISPRPDRRAFWIKGYWHWEGSRWDWVSGRWDRAANPRSRWIAPRYRREGSIWRYEPPHWSHVRVVEGDEYRRWREEHRRN
jgi:YXWGXW repeat-containing protein